MQALVQLVTMYQHNRGLPSDSDQAYEEKMKWYQKAAEQGHAEAQHKLGTNYEIGFKTSSFRSRRNEQDYGEAVKWYTEAAEQGLPIAQYDLGRMYRYGKGVQENDSEAVKWYQKAAEQGHVEAQMELGLMYEDGQGVKQNYAEAAKWYQKAAEQGHVEAQQILGRMYAKLGKIYEDGQGVKQDYAEAAKWYRKAEKQGHDQATDALHALKLTQKLTQKAESGNVGAQMELGLMCEKGKGVKRDYAEAAKWYRKAEKQGHDQATDALHALKLTQLTQQAESGYVEAQMELGLMYEDGQGVNTKAAKWYRRAAKQGHAEAQMKLGELYKRYAKTHMAFDELDEGYEDYAEAAEWYRKAEKQGHDQATDALHALKLTLKLTQEAKSGNVEAQYQLAVIYQNGQGVTKCEDTAKEWYEKAAKQGHTDAQFQLARLEDILDTSMVWYVRAANQGHTEAQEYLSWEAEAEAPISTWYCL